MTTLGVDSRRNFLSHRHAAFGDRPDVKVLIATRAGIRHVEMKPVTLQHARVTHLAARFRVKWRPIENDDAPLSRGEPIDMFGDGGSSRDYTYVGDVIDGVLAATDRLAGGEPYLTDNGILPIAYSSLVPLSTWRAVEVQASAKTAELLAEGEAADAPFRVMAEKYAVSEAQVLLRWAL